MGEGKLCHRIFSIGRFLENLTLIISPVAQNPSLQKMSVETEKPVFVGNFTSGQRTWGAKNHAYTFPEKPVANSAAATSV
jgi:hypothetical protein